MTATGVPTPLSAYLIHWNAPEWLARSIETVRASVGISPKIAVIDNSASLPSMPGIRVIRPARNVGFSGAANMALTDWFARGGSPWCLIGAHDLLVGPETLLTLLTVGERHPRLGLIGPGFGWVSSNSRIASHPDYEEVLWTPGACHLLRRACVAQVGGYDYRLGSYGEDVDYCGAVRRGGWKVGVVPAADANTIGSRVDREWQLRNGWGNRVLVTVKSSGYPAGAATLGRLGVSWVRHALLSVVPGDRAASHRTVRGTYAGAVWRGAYLLLADLCGPVRRIEISSADAPEPAPRRGSRARDRRE
jgi:GT2 family glycosyltransferase